MWVRSILSNTALAISAILFASSNNRSTLDAQETNPPPASSKPQEAITKSKLIKEREDIQQEDNKLKITYHIRNTGKRPIKPDEIIVVYNADLSNSRPTYDTGSKVHATPRRVSSTFNLVKPYHVVVPVVESTNPKDNCNEIITVQFPNRLFRTLPLNNDDLLKVEFTITHQHDDIDILLGNRSFEFYLEEDLIRDTTTSMFNLMKGNLDLPLARPALTLETNLDYEIPKPPKVPVLSRIPDDRKYVDRRHKDSGEVVPNSIYLSYPESENWKFSFNPIEVRGSDSFGFSFENCVFINSDGRYSIYVFEYPDNTISEAYFADLSKADHIYTFWDNSSPKEEMGQDDTIEPNKRKKTTKPESYPPQGYFHETSFNFDTRRNTKFIRIAICITASSFGELVIKNPKIELVNVSKEDLIR